MCTKKEQFSAKWQKNLELKKRNHHDDSEKNSQLKGDIKIKKNAQNSMKII